MKQSFGARTIAYPLPVFVIGTYDRTGKPNAMVSCMGRYMFLRIRRVSLFLSAQLDIPTGI